MSSSALRWPRADPIEGMQKKTCSGWEREAGSEGDEEKKDGREITLLTTLMASFVR